MSRNVYKEDVDLIRLPSVATSEDRGLSLCGQPFPILADTSDSTYWKNDRTGLAFKLDTMSVELEASDGTLIAAPGMAVNFPNQSDAVGFVIDWRQLVDGGGALRCGCYKIKVSWTLSGLSGSFYYGSYDLKNYSTDTSEGTARLFVVLNDFVRSEGINYKDSGFATTFRFEGRFGDMQPNYEITNNIFTNRTNEKVRIQANRTYVLKTQFLRSCFTHKIDHEHLLAANKIYVSDYNAFNHKEYKDFPVILDEEQSPEYNYPGGSILASVTAYFKDKKSLSESKYDGNIQGSDNIILELPIGASACANGTAENSDGTFTLAVPSGTTQPIPDSQLNVNSVDVGDVVSVKTIDVNVTDGTNPVTPTSTTLVGNTLTIVTPKDLEINIPYLTSDTTSSITILSGSNGVITAADTTGLTTVTYEINAVAATLPLTLAVADILTINFDAAAADGVIQLSGTYA